MRVARASFNLIIVIFCKPVDLVTIKKHVKFENQQAIGLSTTKLRNYVKIIFHAQTLDVNCTVHVYLASDHCNFM